MPVGKWANFCFSITFTTTYGGGGKTTFALPDLRGRVPIGQGQGPGLSSYELGEKGGQEAVTLTAAQMPAHNHAYSDADQQPTGKPPVSVQTGSRQTKVQQNNGSSTSAVTQNTGSNQPHENRQPYMGVNYVIALQGVFPSRN